MNKLFFIVLFTLMITIARANNDEAKKTMDEAASALQKNLSLLKKLIGPLDLTGLFDSLDDISKESDLLSKEALEKISTAAHNLDTLAVDHSQLNTEVANMALMIKLETEKIQEKCKKYNPEGDAPLEGIDLKVWTVYMKKYVRTLDDSADKLQAIVDQMAKLEADAGQYREDSNDISRVLKHDRDESSDQMQGLISKKRAEVYGGCSACVLFPPSCIVCYGVAIGVIEGDYVKEVQGRIDTLETAVNGMIDQVETLSTSFDEAQKTFNAEKNEYQQVQTKLQFYADDITDLQDLVEEDKDFRDSTLDDIDSVLALSEELYELANKNLGLAPTDDNNQ